LQRLDPAVRWNLFLWSLIIVAVAAAIVVLALWWPRRFRVPGLIS
jgi:hypothetical protein